MKKPFFWDKKELSIYAILLIPFSIILKISNLFFKFAPKYKSKKIISICIGNIYLGGTGKTPATIKIFKIFKKLKKKVIVGKKFYSEHADEIKLLNKETSLITDKNRLDLLKKSEKKNYEIIIFDDGLQDKNLDYDIKIVCFDSKNWIGNGLTIPAGPLRENLYSLKKFDAVFIKNTDVTNHNLNKVIKKVNPEIEIFNLRYKIKNFNEFDLRKKYLMFCGIGNPHSFKDSLKRNKFLVKEYIFFPDHHNYTKKDIKDIIDKAKKEKMEIITTEKDYSKIPNIYKKIIKIVKIEISLNQNKFIKFLKNKIDV